jgi:peptidoglycan/LPS O-acetylase OafA/YrhL
MPASILVDQAQIPTTVAPPLTAQRLATVNGLRGLAIIGVMSFHMVAGVFSAQAMSPWLSVPLTNGWSGVNLFFILSGFVLFLPYAATEGASGGFDRPFDFYRRRCCRLLPLFCVGALATWAIAVLGGASAGLGQLLSVLSLGFILDAHSFGPSFNIPLWSLGDEIAFSLLFPFLVASFRRHGAARVLATALALALAMRILGIWRFPALEGPTFNSDMFLCRIDEFVLGMALAWGYATGRLPQRPLLCAGAGVGLVLAAWIGFDLVLRGVLPPICRAGLNDMLDAGLSGIVVAALVPRTVLVTSLSWPPLQVAGMMCYSLYIWHLPLLNLVAPGRSGMPAAELVGALIAFLSLAVLVAALSYRFIEFPRVGDWRRLFLLPARARPLAG